jgi:hypothetical protein
MQVHGNCTAYGRVNAVRIMATVRENLVSIDKGTTSQHLIKQQICIHGGIVEQILRHKPHVRHTESRG